ncbi:MAG TPA: ScpA family protein [Amaricoccus sp.]|nr:ScpA family protein [Amaricoccus sp.]
MPEDFFDAVDAVDGAGRLAAEALVVDLDGFEGPLDLLLALARSQKVDLRRISILGLAEQYLGFVETAKRLRIELAADYLVMAAWLAFLKSRLLLPPDPAEAGPSADEMAAQLALRLARLEAMRDAAARLMGRDQLGRDVFGRGEPEAVTTHRRTAWTASLLELMRAYARIRTRDDFRPLHLARGPVWTMEQALERMRGMLGTVLGWAELSAWLPDDWTDAPERRRSATAGSFAAALELAKAGRVELRQEAAFRPIYLKPVEQGEPG